MASTYSTWGRQPTIRLRRIYSGGTSTKVKSLTTFRGRTFDEVWKYVERTSNKRHRSTTGSKTFIDRENAPALLERAQGRLQHNPKEKVWRFQHD